MPFRPLRLLLAWDPDQGLCAEVAPRLRELLEHRAFVVETLELREAEDSGLRRYDGLVLGCPVPGAGLRRHGPGPLVDGWVRAQRELDQVKTALFSVHRLRPGHTLRNLRQLVHDQGGQVLVTHSYSALRPRLDEHVLPTECMVRIR